MTTLKSRIAVAAMAIAFGGSLFANTADADTISQAMSVGLVQNEGGQECAIGLAAGSDFIFGVAVWNADTQRYGLANGGVKQVRLEIVNTKSSRPCRVDVHGKALKMGDEAIPIHDLKLEEGEGSAVAVETVPRVPDQGASEVPAWLIAGVVDGRFAIVKATLSNVHIAQVPFGTYAGLVTLTGSANAP